MRLTYSAVRPTSRSLRLRVGLSCATMLMVVTAVCAQTSFDYNVQPRTFRACRLLVPYQTSGGGWAIQSSDDRSLIFEGMRRLPGKPAGWEIVNPLAPAAATTADPNLRILPSTPRSMLPAGTRGYWEVVLDPHPEWAPAPIAPTGATPPAINARAYTRYAGPNLDKFDLIYIWGGAAGNSINIDLYRPEWRAALQRAVYNGAVVWVDGNLNGSFVRNFVPSGPLQSIDETGFAAPFNFTYGGVTTGAVRTIARSLLAPVGWGGADRLLSYPFQLRDIYEVPYIGHYPTWTLNTVPPVDDPRSASMDGVILNDSSWQPVMMVGTTSGVTTNAAVLRYGSGAVVVTAGDVGYDIVHWWFGARRNKPLGHEAPDCEFAWNVAALAGGAQQAQGNAQAQAASTTVAPPPLGIGWQYPDRFSNDETDPEAHLGPVVSSPVVNKGLVYSVSLPYRGTPARQAQLMCFDADPSRDLDADGRADDAVTAADVDYSLGRSYDRVWSVGLEDGWTPRTAAPCVGTIVRPGGTDLIDIVIVSLVRDNPGSGAAGEVRAYSALDGVELWRRQLNPYDTGAGNAGMVVDLSTPVFHEGFVYVLASEYDRDIDAGGNEECAYGRAHAFAANGSAASWVYPDPTDNPAGTVDSDVAGGGGGDHATPEVGKSLPPFQDPLWVAGADPFDPRPEIPPFPTPRPVLVQPTGPLSNTSVEIMIRCSAPVSLRTSATAHQTDIDPNNGGSDYYLIPTPSAASTVDNGYNAYAYKVVLPWGVTATNTRPRNNSWIVCRVDDTNIDSVGSGIWQDPADGRVYMYFRSGPARELLLPSLAGGTTDPLTLAVSGAAIMTPGNANQALEYETWDATTSTWVPREVKVRLYGMVRRVDKLPRNQRLVTSGSAWEGGALYATDTVEGNTGRLRNFDYDGTYNADNVTNYTGGPGTISLRDADSGVVRWEYRPTSALRPDVAGTPARAQLAKGGFAVERSDDTAYAAATAAVQPGTLNATGQIPQVLGLNLAPRLQVQLNGVAGAEVRVGKPFSITTISSDSASEVAVPETVTDVSGQIVRVYTLDATSRTITFNTQLADWVNSTIGSLWGKPIWVSFYRTDPANAADSGSDTQIDDTNNEALRLHVLPDILRFQYTPGAVRLKHGMVGAITTAGVRTPMAAFYLPNGVPLQRDPLPVDDTIFFAQLDGLPAAWTGVMPRGVLDVSALRTGNGELMPPGTEIVVEYDYWDPVTRAGVTTRERHQIPVRFGSSLAAPVLADRTLHIGTQGYLPSGLRGDTELLAAPDTNSVVGFNSTRKSLLSIMVDPISGIVRGSLGQAAIPVEKYADDTVDQGTPVVEGAAAVDGGGLIVGSNLMTRLGQISSAAKGSDPGYQTEGAGFVSRMKPQRTLICDNTRLVECVGQKQSWVCAGSLAPAWHEALEVSNLGNQELKRTPFSRPAKAIYLSSGNILVADTGNERVIEIDRQGKQVWPLDQYGYDYYTSSRNARLDLERPSDCFRYYVEYAGGVRRTTTNGALLPIDRVDWDDWTTWTGTEVHTVIADPGHDRVVDVVTYLDIRADGASTVDLLPVQTHRVDVLTPGTIRMAGRTGAGKVAYTRAQPIFDPTPGSTHSVVGFLCVASNLHQLVIVEQGTRLVNPPASRALPAPAVGNWQWLAWLYDADLADGRDVNDNPLVFRNIRDVQLSLEYPTAFVTVTCGQFGGRLKQLGPNIPAHFLADEGAGIFEYAINVGGAAGSWARYDAVDADPATAPAVSADDPIWWFTRLNYLYSNIGTGARRTVSNLRYADNDGSIHWLDMPWNPVSAIRLPADRRPVGGQRQARHLVTNYAELTQNLNRNNVRSTASDAVGPASLFSSVLVIDSDDRNDASPDNDVHDLDRREIIPDPADVDWSDPFNQPTYADRG